MLFSHLNTRAPAGGVARARRENGAAFAAPAYLSDGGPPELVRKRVPFQLGFSHTHTHTALKPRLFSTCAQVSFSSWETRNRHRPTGGRAPQARGPSSCVCFFSFISVVPFVQFEKTSWSTVLRGTSLDPQQTFHTLVGLSRRQRERLLYSQRERLRKAPQGETFYCKTRRRFRPTVSAKNANARRRRDRAHLARLETKSKHSAQKRTVQGFLLLSHLPQKKQKSLSGRRAPGRRGSPSSPNSRRRAPSATRAKRTPSPSRRSPRSSTRRSPTTT